MKQSSKQGLEIGNMGNMENPGLCFSSGISEKNFCEQSHLQLILMNSKKNFKIYSIVYQKQRAVEAVQTLNNKD